MQLVRVVRGGAMPKGPESQTVTRRSTRIGEVSVAEARNGPQTTTGCTTTESTPRTCML